MAPQNPAVGVAVETEERLTPETGVYILGPCRILVVERRIRMVGYDTARNTYALLGEIGVPCPIEESDVTFARRACFVTQRQTPPEGVGCGQAVAIVLCQGRVCCRKERERKDYLSDFHCDMMYYSVMVMRPSR